jgi:hypothetical protein
LRAKGPLGSVPQVDWEAVDIDLSAQNISQLPPVTNAEPYNFGGFAPTSNPPLYTSSNNELPNASGTMHTSSAAGTSRMNASPTDALINDIDWVRTLPNSFTFFPPGYTPNLVRITRLTIQRRTSGISCLEAPRWVLVML